MITRLMGLRPTKPCQTNYAIKFPGEGEVEASFESSKNVPIETCEIRNKSPLSLKFLPRSQLGTSSSVQRDQRITNEHKEWPILWLRRGRDSRNRFPKCPLTTFVTLPPRPPLRHRNRVCNYRSVVWSSTSTSSSSVCRKLIRLWWKLVPQIISSCCCLIYSPPDRVIIDPIGGAGEDLSGHFWLIGNKSAPRFRNQFQTELDGGASVLVSPSKRNEKVTQRKRVGNGKKRFNICRPEVNEGVALPVHYCAIAEWVSAVRSAGPATDRRTRRSRSGTNSEIGS